MMACAADLRQVRPRLVSWRVVGAPAKDHIAWIELETNREHADGDRHGLTRVVRGAFVWLFAVVSENDNKTAGVVSDMNGHQAAPPHSTIAVNWRPAARSKARSSSWITLLAITRFA
jgi:hypothetical protein